MLWTPDTFTFDALGYAFTVPRNDVSDTDSNSLNRVTGDIYKCGRLNISLLANSLWPPTRRAEDGGQLKFSKQVHYFFRVLFLSLYILFSNAIFICSGDHMNLKAFLKVMVLYKSFLSIFVSLYTENFPY